MIYNETSCIGLLPIRSFLRRCTMGLCYPPPAGEKEVSLVPLVAIIVVVVVAWLAVVFSHLLTTREVETGRRIKPDVPC